MHHQLNFSHLKFLLFMSIVLQAVLQRVMTLKVDLRILRIMMLQMQSYASSPDLLTRFAQRVELHRITSRAFIA